jgi:hypothetical protein
MSMKELTPILSTLPEQTLFKEQKEIAEQNLKALKEAGVNQQSLDHRINAAKTGGNLYNPALGQFHHQNRETESMR